MADKPVRMSAGEYDGMDIWVSVGPINQRIQLLSDLVAEQAERASVDTRDQHGPVVLDVEIASDFCCHD
ncbi:hypothetical protein GCM10022234_22340 [Aeromicrobium panaciterrae]